MTSKSHEIFLETHHRGLRMVEASVALWKSLESSEIDPTIEQYNGKNVLSEMGRAGIVIGVSAFDDYFTRRFTESVIPIIKEGNASKPLIEFLGNCGLDVREALELLTMKRPFRRIRKLVVDNLENRTTLKSSCEEIIKRRHAIVHQGDVNKHGTLTKVS